MNKRSVLHARTAKLLLVIAMVSALSVKAAYAYIDPGTGSYLLQVLAAGLFAVIFAVGTFWRKIKSGLASVFSKKAK